MGEVILDIDVGNTRTKWRLTASEYCQKGVLANEMLGQLADAVGCNAVGRVRIACVATPSVQEQLFDHVVGTWGCVPEFATSALECAGLKNGYANPLQLGVDRWLAAVAAVNLGYGACLVIDAGSAVTLDTIDDEGLFLGGYIIPGLQLQQRCLIKNTGNVRCDEASEWPENYLQYGISTTEAVQHGAAFTLISVVEKSIAQFKHRWPNGRVCITGGDAPRIVYALSQTISCEPDLVFTGLALALP